jgi:hypothetical protein
VDYSLLSLDEQIAHLEQAHRAFQQNGVVVKGFRCPYLRWSTDTLKALDKLDFSYDSSQALAWSVGDGNGTEAYRRVLRFYRARSADDYPSLPRLANGLLRIPYSLPDDEALVERFHLTEASLMVEMWQEVLRRTYESGELFTLGLHPERIALCERALRALLSQAQSLSPAVWISRLDDVADWWRRRAKTTYRVTRKEDEGVFQMNVEGPPGTVVLAREVSVDAPTKPWTKNRQRVLADSFVFRADRLPLIGVSPDTPDALINFLRQQGYLIESGVDARSCTFYLDRKNYTPEDERPILREIEHGRWPLLYLSRWPDGARSALSITGDIDALSLWDYVLRVFS